MLESQKTIQQVNALEERMATLATEANAIVELRDADAGYDAYVKERRDKAIEIGKATKEYEDLVVKLRGEQRTEDIEAQALMAANTDTSGAVWTPELRELRQAAQAANIGHYMRAAETGREVDRRRPGVQAARPGRGRQAGGIPLGNVAGPGGVLRAWTPGSWRKCARRSPAQPPAPPRC